MKFWFRIEESYKGGGGGGGRRQYGAEKLPGLAILNFVIYTSNSKSGGFIYSSVLWSLINRRMRVGD